MVLTVIMIFNSDNKYWPTSSPVERIAPRPTIRRLTFYLRALKRLHKEGVDDVSCTKLKNLLGFDSTQIRKDLSVTGITGKPKVGYRVSELVPAIEIYLGWDRSKSAVLMGAGSLGKALLGYTRLSEFAHLNIVAAFDRDPSVIGTTIYGIEVADVSTLEQYVGENNIEIGIIAVPAASAQSIAENLVQVNIKTIWNFAPFYLQMPSDVIVENVDMSISLAMLTTRMAKRMRYVDNSKTQKQTTK